jgi:hypothetical protein
VGKAKIWIFGGGEGHNGGSHDLIGWAKPLRPALGAIGSSELGNKVSNASLRSDTSLNAILAT